MRIIAGKFRGRTLLANPGQTTRPITDRVKEALFERLEQRIGEKRVADLFAGTGTLGLEALSRGARSVVFIEKDRRAWERLKENVARIGVEEQTLCWRADVLRCSFRPKGVSDMLPYDIVFFDPPFRMIGELKPGRPLYRALQRLAREGITAPDALLLLRTPQHAHFEPPPAWRLDRTLEFSNMTVHLFEKSGNGPLCRSPAPVVG